MVKGLVPIVPKIAQNKAKQSNKNYKEATYVRCVFCRVSDNLPAEGLEPTLPKEHDFESVPFYRKMFLSAQ